MKDYFIASPYLSLPPAKKGDQEKVKF